jgi:hypothetical protein
VVRVWSCWKASPSQVSLPLMRHKLISACCMPFYLGYRCNACFKELWDRLVTNFC